MMLQRVLIQKGSRAGKAVDERLIESRSVWERMAHTAEKIPL